MVKTRMVPKGRLLALMLVLSMMFVSMPLHAYAKEDRAESVESVESTESTESDESVESEAPAEGSASQEVGGGEAAFTQMVEVPDPVLDEGVSGFFDSVGGKILGVLLKLLSVGLVLTCVADLVFVAVPFTQGIFLSTERSGFPIISNEAHQAAGVPREMPANRQRGAGGAYGGAGGAYGGYGGYGGYGRGGYGGGGAYGQGQNGQQESALSGGGMTAYLKSSFVRLILVFAFAVFMTSGIYIHVGYSIGNFVTGLLGKI